jgi:RNA polymerase sigma-70 factor (ECF subfamily)
VAEARADGAPGPERVAEQRESAATWRARLDALPSRYRRAVELRHVSGLSYPELALALDRPLGTVKSDVHRGVRLLREVVMDEMRGDNHEVAP